jgi:hypothetical protein
MKVEVDEDEVVEVDELLAQILIHSQYTTNIVIDEMLVPLTQKALKLETDIALVLLRYQIIHQIIQ